MLRTSNQYRSSCTRDLSFLWQCSANSCSSTGRSQRDFCRFCSSSLIAHRINHSCGSPERTWLETVCYRTTNLLNASVYIQVDLALFPVALDWSQRGKLHKVLEIFCQVKVKKEKKKENMTLSGITVLGASKSQPPVGSEPSSSSQLKPGLIQVRINKLGQSVPMTYVPTRAISDEEGPSPQSQNFSMQNVLHKLLLF